jgi:hypothetical protein
LIADFTLFSWSLLTSAAPKLMQSGEHCENWKSTKDKNICLACYWAFPEKYNHVAMQQIRRVDLVWPGEEMTQYEKLKSDAVKAGLEIPQFVKEVLAKALK